MRALNYTFMGSCERFWELGHARVAPACAIVAGLPAARWHTFMFIP